MATKYIHFTEQQKEQARQTDIAEMLRSQGETLRRSGSEYEWRDGSEKVTVRGNLWFHQYEEVGGDAIDFVRRFYNKDYPEAMEYLLGGCVGTLMVSPPVQRNPKVPFELPEKNDNMRRVFAYLLNRRGIDRYVLYAFAHKGLIYESADYHNVVFVGKDKDGVSVHAHKRGSGSESSYKGNVTGSNPKYSFHWNGGNDIVDNTQLTIFGGFAPQSTSAETLSKALGSRTVMSGSVSRSKNDPSESLQMIERPLMTPDELKSMPKGQFVVMKTGFYPMKVKLKLFFKWGIHFDEEHPYTVSDQGNREVKYASKKDITDGIIKKYHPELLEPATPSNDESSSGGQNQQMTEHHQPASIKKNDEKDKNGGTVLQTVPKNRRTPLSQPPKNTEVTSDGQT